MTNETASAVIARLRECDRTFPTMGEFVDGKEAAFAALPALLDCSEALAAIGRRHGCECAPPEPELCLYCRGRAALNALGRVKL